MPHEDIRFTSDSLLAPQKAILCPGNHLICRSSVASRYTLGADCSIEHSSEVQPSDWEADSQIFEHVGLKSGGGNYYDPCTPVLASNGV